MIDSYTTPKKIKHKRKPVKMAILKYYRVDSDGKIKRLRRECPADSCGPSVMMAQHADRQYCGKCGLTVSLFFRSQFSPHADSFLSLLVQIRR